MVLTVLSVARPKHEALQESKALVVENVLELLHCRIEIRRQRNGVGCLRGSNNHVHRRLDVLLDNRRHIQLLDDLFESGDGILMPAQNQVIVITGC